MSTGRGHVVRTADGWRLAAVGDEAEELNRFLRRIDLRGLADGSLRTYAYDMLSLLRWADPFALSAMGREQMYEYIAARRDELSPITINRRIRLLDVYLRFVRGEPDERPRCRRPVRTARRRLPLMREPRVLKPPLSFEQVRKFWLCLRTLRDQCIFGLMWTSGLRICEVLALRICDIDFDEHTLELIGKGRKQRNVPMAPWIGRLIRRYLIEERPHSDRPELFLVMKGPRRAHPMTYAGARRLFRYYRGKLNLPQAHPHRLRHTFAVNMIRNGVSVPTLMRLLGHAWPSTALRYVYFDDRQLREDYEKAIKRVRGVAEGL